MNILAVTPFAGDQKLVDMTKDCIAQLIQCNVPDGVKIRIYAVNNGAKKELGMQDLSSLQETGKPGFISIDVLNEDRNYGFGVGVNRGIDCAMIADGRKFDQVLVFNNDLQFPDKNWLVELLREVEGRYVLSPRTDVTATPEACFPEAVDFPAQRVGQVSAFCWLVPIRVIEVLNERWGWPLFNPQFTNYGSDDATAAILRATYGATPFKVVHRSWVKHLKAKTANQLGIKAGTKELLTDLKKWKSANKLK
jgi:hypothetical protein